MENLPEQDHTPTDDSAQYPIPGWRARLGLTPLGPFGEVPFEDRMELRNQVAALFEKVIGYPGPFRIDVGNFATQVSGSIRVSMTQALGDDQTTADMAWNRFMGLLEANAPKGNAYSSHGGLVFKGAADLQMALHNLSTKDMGRPVWMGDARWFKNSRPSSREL